MKLMSNPKIEFTQVELITSTKSKLWIAGQHKWYPVTVSFENFEEMMEFMENRYEANKNIKVGLMNTFPIGNCVLTNATIDKLFPNELTAVVSFDGARIQE